MSITEERAEEIQRLEVMWGLPHAESSVALRGARGTIWSWGLLGAWLMILGSIIIFEPPPADPDAPLALWETLFATAFFAGLSAMVAGLVRGRSFGFWASVWASLAGMAISLACLATDHHLGGWWAIEMGGFGSLLALSVAGMKRA